ncbi:hypothetical protein [Pimelobacter simplex]|uniref:hypothetical protein n=1 Tax=Nocardioides simplex TaxID=2045 RepID=UPI00214F79BA|nr:hypothetical protein [Pimelobacter simplex]UUW88416.1 hypothetical protein M0M43_22095 [Pimelobacter simplex]UUW97920.1 hypothetical protein M0M48_10740 [Pimelobacter simplex]
MSDTESVDDPRERFAFWVAHRTKIFWVAVGLVAGLTFGAWIGSAATACAGGTGGCRIHWQAVEAIGTWFGSLGGLFAVVFAIIAWRSDEHDRADERRRERMAAADRRELELREARRVRFRPSSMSTDGTLITGLHLMIQNENTKIPVHRVVLTLDLDQIEDGNGSKTWPPIPAVKANGSEGHRLHLVQGRRVKGQLPVVEVPAADRSAWFSQLQSSSTIDYVLNDVHWRRRGLEEPERLGPA